MIPPLCVTSTWWTMAIPSSTQEELPTLEAMGLQDLLMAAGMAALELLMAALDLLMAALDLLMAALDLLMAALDLLMAALDLLMAALDLLMAAVMARQHHLMQAVMALQHHLMQAVMDQDLLMAPPRLAFSGGKGLRWDLQCAALFRKDSVANFVNKPGPAIDSALE